MTDLAWKLFVVFWVMLIAVSCGAGIVGALNPGNVTTTTTYNTRLER